MAVATADPVQLTQTVASAPGPASGPASDPSSAPSTPPVSGLTPTVASPPPASAGPDIIDKVNTLSDSQRKYFFSQMNEDQRTRFQQALQQKIAAKQAQPPPPQPGFFQNLQNKADAFVNDPTGFHQGTLGQVEHFGQGVAQSIEGAVMHPVKTALAAGQQIMAGGGTGEGYGTTAMTGDPKVDALNAEAKADARNSIEAQVEEMKQHPANALGQLAGGVALGEMVKGVAEPVGMAAKGVVKAVSAVKDAIPSVKDVAENVSGVTTAVEKAGEKQVPAAQKHQEDVADYNQKVAETSQANAEAEKLAQQQTQQNHTDAVEHHAQITQDAEDLDTQKGDLARREMELRSRLTDRVRDVATSAKSFVDAQWDKIRAAVKAKKGADGMPVDDIPSDTLLDKVNEVKAGFKGSTETTPEFENIIKRASDAGQNETNAHVLKDEQDKLIADRNMPKADGSGPATTYADLSDAWKGVVDETVKNNRAMRAAGIPTDDPAGAPVLGWDHLRAMSSELGDWLRSAYRKDQMGQSVKGELVDGVQQVKAHVDAMVDEIAARAKVKGQLDTAKKTYQIYRDTFKEPTGPSGSGSGVAQSLNARPGDIYNATQPFLDANKGQIARNMLTGSPTEGPHWDPRAGQLVDSLRNVVAQRKSLPKTPEIAPFEEPEPVAAPKPKALPEAPEPPEPLDVEKIKRAAIINLSRKYRTLQPWQVRVLATSIIGGLGSIVLGHSGIGEFGGPLGAAVAFAPQVLSRLIDLPTFREWMSRGPSGQDLSVLSKIPDSDLIKLKDAATGQVVNLAQAGKPVKVAASTQQWLGPQNVRKIAQAIAAGGAGVAAGQREVTAPASGQKLRVGDTISHVGHTGKVTGVDPATGKLNVQWIDTGTSEGAK